MACRALSFDALVRACSAAGLSRNQAAAATGWTDLTTDAALERYVRFNAHMPAAEAARQLAQCAGQVSASLFGTYSK